MEETKHVRGGIPQERHSLLCSDCGFCPEAPATEKRRRKEAGAPPAVGAGGEEEQARPWRERRGRPWTPQGSSAQRNKSILAPAPATPAWEGPLSPQGMSAPMTGLVHQSGSKGTRGKASPVLLGL